MKVPMMSQTMSFADSQAANQARQLYAAGDHQRLLPIIKRLASTYARVAELQMIAGLNARTRRWPVGEYVADNGCWQFGVARKERKVDNASQQKIGSGAGKHNGQSLPERPRGEATSDIARIRFFALHPENSHIAAQRKNANLVLGLPELEPY